MERKQIVLVVAVALAVVLTNVSPALGRRDNESEPEALARKAIQQASALIRQSARDAAQGDEDVTEPQREARKELQRARDCFDSGDYDNAIDHAEDVEEILDWQYIRER